VCVAPETQNGTIAELAVVGQEGERENQPVFEATGRFSSRNPFWNTTRYTNVQDTTPKSEVVSNILDTRGMLPSGGWGEKAAPPVTARIANTPHVVRERAWETAGLTAVWTIAANELEEDLRIGRGVLPRALPEFCDAST
jgi:hypothetical protein